MSYFSAMFGLCARMQNITLLLSPRERISLLNRLINMLVSVAFECRISSPGPNLVHSGPGGGLGGRRRAPNVSLA